MIIVPHSNGHEPRTWKGLQTENGRSASLTCPQGHVCSLSNHEILSDGSVHPSVICPEDGCGFHEFVKLKDWSNIPTPLPLPRKRP